MNIREQILQPRKAFTESVPCPELGADVSLLVQRLSARQFMELAEKVKEKSDQAYAYWIVATVVQEDGSPVFTDADVVALAEQDEILIERLTTVAMKLNVLSKPDAEKN